MAKYEDGVMYYFIINPASQSGRGYKIWKKIEQRLVRDGVEYQAYLTEYAGRATEYARKLTSHCKEARVIVVVGGDGTMNGRNRFLRHGDAGLYSGGDRQ